MLRERLVELIGAGLDVVVDFSFWQRERRDCYKDLVRSAGGAWRLIYLKTHPCELRRRLRERAARFDANAAFPTSRLPSAAGKICS